MVAKERAVPMEWIPKIELWGLQGRVARGNDKKKSEKSRK